MMKTRKSMPVWSRAELRLLGKMPDTTAARRTGRTIAAVAARRTLLGRPKLEARYRFWTAREDALLASLPREEIARRTGRTLSSIRRRQQRLASACPVLHLRTIAAVESNSTPRCPTKARPLSWNGRTVKKQRFYRRVPLKNRRRKAWTTEKRALVGTMPDRQFAIRFGMSLAVVRGYRYWHRIPIYGSLNHRWTDAEHALLGTMSDHDLAKRMGLPVSKVQTQRQNSGIPVYAPLRHKWTSAEEALLGTMPDAQLAARLSISESRVRIRRQKLRIHPSNAPNYWTIEARALVGKLSDRQLVQRFGMSLSAVKHYRQRHGIPNPSPLRQSMDRRRRALLGSISGEERSTRAMPDAKTSKTA